MGYELMEERFAFWKGVATGVLGGIAISALARLTFGSLAAAAPAVAPAVTADIGAARRIIEFELRREHAESAGDPRITSPLRGEVVPSDRAFERPGGAPGGRTPAERLDMPGQPGQVIDHSAIY